MTIRNIAAPIGLLLLLLCLNPLPASAQQAESLESLNVPGHFIRHRFSLGEITPIVSDLDRNDGTFVLRPALTGTPGAVSLESVNYPGHFLRHQDYRIKLHRFDGSDLFRKDASFMARPGAQKIPGVIAFESVNFPDHFIRHSNFNLWIAKNDGSALFAQDRAFRRRPALSVAAAPPTPTPPLAQGAPADWIDMLAAHNERRRQHCAPDLTWSSELAAAAQAYADRCILGQHGSAGENMADWFRTQNGAPVLPAASDRQVFEDVWYCEVNHYNFSNPAIVGGFKRACDPPVNGHFTQVVWHGTRQLGCGRATCNIGGQQGTHWVCRYAPAGNINTPDALAQNVRRSGC